ncbi:echinoderm microtubule-associated protein-like 1 isoform X2 [Takifugu rubripes]|uniref:echinoderm microtubule-associated protein-like 1 isoform X2 n=1 Tax=Takifugu rubripes TaxID=31033 RepID=UPI0011459437|nr:echinoderm microtubule-associated protein-like 1 isoform X2 [Takifugu rubripes]
MEDGFSSYSSLYDTSSLLQFCNDDSASAASSMEVTDRIASLEQRVQMQEDEIQLLKSALADVVRRLNVSEEQQAMGSRRGPTKALCVPRIDPAKLRKSPSADCSVGKSARPMIATLPLRSTLNNGTVLPKKASGTLPSPSGPGSRKDTSTPASKSTVRRANSNEHVGTLTRKDSGESKGNRTRAGSTGSNSSGKRSDSKQREPVFNAGMRRVTHCKEEGYVKMYLKGRPITMFLPKDQVDSYCLEARADPPGNKLKLDWVYGYRGRDCRSNLYLLPTGETVYFIASVVVLFNVDEQLQRHYTGHTDDIKCLAVHPDKITIATGQVAGTTPDGKLAPHVRVWDSVSLNTLHVLGSGFFDRALVCLAFSKSNGGNTLCAVDDSNDHVLSVWDWQREDRLAEVKCSNDSVFGVDFHPTDCSVIVTCGKSHLYFWSLEKGVLVKKQGLFEKQEKPKFVLCVTFAENGNTITGDSSGNILAWGKGTNRISHVIQGAHEGSIFALCMLRNGTLLSGGKDRRLISWDSSYQQIQTVEVPELFGPIRTIAEGRGETVLIGTTKNFVLQGSLDGDFISITQGHTDELWGLAVHPWKPYFLSCGYDRQVCLWDSSSHQLIWAKIMEDAAQSAGFHPSGAVVAIGTQTGRWLVLDTDSKDLVTVHTDGNEQLSVLKYGPDGNFLAIGSHDNYIYIYAVSENGRKYSRLGKCSGHSSFITHLDWSVDSQYLVSNSGDYEILYWIPSVCKQVVSVETTRDIDWATYTCPLGFQVFGLWPDGSDGTDVNAVCRSHGKSLLVTGDDFGKVHLFTYPCSQFRAPSHLYSGHSSHVTNVSFLYDDSYLVSIGGKDMSVMQWRIV